MIKKEKRKLTSNWLKQWQCFTRVMKEDKSSKA